MGKKHSLKAKKITLADLKKAKGGAKEQICVTENNAKIEHRGGKEP